MNRLQKQVLASWVKQAHTAIDQGQSRIEFILHADTMNRSVALRAYHIASVENATGQNQKLER